MRGHPDEVLFLTFVGSMWLSGARWLFSWLGISARFDAIERTNPAALVLTGSATLSIAIIFAAGNLGEGPSYSNNYFSAAVGTIGFFLLWLAIEVIAKVSIPVAEERDLASGLRMSVFFLAAALIFGRSIAGDWHSYSGTIRDFLCDSWPVTVLFVMGCFFETRLRPSRQHPFPCWSTSGLIPAALYLSISLVWLWKLGKWEGMPN